MKPPEKTEENTTSTPSHQKTKGVTTRGVATELLSGSIAGAVAKTLIAPLDRTKIIFQTSSVKEFSWRAMGAEMNRIIKEEGVLSLWRGHSATLSRVIPYAALQFASFDTIKSLHGGPMNKAELLMAGAAAGGISVMATYPLDLMRARMAVAGNDHSGLVKNIVRGYRQGGFASLYRGLVPTLAGILPYAGISFASYETMKSYLASERRENTTTVVERLTCGAIAGLAAQTATYSLDIIRRRMQTEGYVRGFETSGERLVKYASMRRTMELIYREEGMKAFFKGLSMNVVKGPIAVGVSFATHDFVRRQLNTWSRGGEPAKAGNVH